MIIGVYPQERVSPQKLLFDLELTTDTRKAAETDDLAQTINYAQLCCDMVAWCNATSYKLVESLADHLSLQILKHYPAQALRLKIIKKPFDLPQCAGVGVQIERTAPEYCINDNHTSREAGTQC